MSRTTKQSGMAMVLALVLVAIFASLAIAFAAGTDVNARQSSNLADVCSARLQAEGGLSYYISMFSGASLPAGVTGGQDLLDAVASILSGTLDGSANLAGQTVFYDGNTITVPEILVNGSDRGFSAQLELHGTENVEIKVTGRDDDVTRAVSVQMSLAPGGSATFDYGIAAGGKVRMTGNASVSGADDPSEASILSATYDDPESFKLTGNCDLEGDIYTSNPDSYVTLTGNVSVGGESVWGGNIDEHIHIGVGDAEFPEVDPTVFEPFATNLVTSSTSTSGNKTFSNIRIVAGANKTFSGNVTLKGVIFIEQPNSIHFSGNVTITGVIVTEDAGEDTYDTNTIKFTGNTTVRGVEDLPDTPEFHDLREMPGAFILAPGFGTQFTGNFGTVSGCMAAETFKFTGNAGGLVKGMIISYGPEEFKLTGNSSLTIDLPDTGELPPGFTTRPTLCPSPDSYKEY